MHKTDIHLSGDGSHTLYSHQFNQYYHNPNGAIAESRHVFFELPGLSDRLNGSDHFNIFEMGFGTGLNIMILMEVMKKIKNPPKIEFHTVEAFPTDPARIALLNYSDFLDTGSIDEKLISFLHDLKPGVNSLTIDRNMSLNLYFSTFDEMPELNARFNAIFFDPFSPDVNPGLWTPDVFRKLARISQPDVLLSTYGAASSARAAMAVAGWKVARAPGALGKREMTLASLDARYISIWKRVNEERLIERYNAGEFHLDGREGG